MNIDKISKEYKKYISENFLNLSYDQNENKNVAFNLLIPKKWKLFLNEQDDPFKFTNNRNVVLFDIEDEQANIVGSVSVLNTTLELNPASIDFFLSKKLLNSFFIRTKIDYSINGVWADSLLMNEDNSKITRMKTFRNFSLYYTIYFTFNNFYDYMKYAEDVSIIFKSFNLKNPLQVGIPTKFDLLKTDKFDLLYPKNWRIKERNDENNIVSINIYKAPNESTLFNIRTYENTIRTSKNIAEDYIDRLKNVGGFSFDVIKDGSVFYDEKNDFYKFKLLNAKDTKGNPVEIYFEISSNGDRKILGAIITKNFEDTDFLLYAENERFLNIFLNVIKVSFFEGNKLEDTDWINLYNQGE